MQTHEFLTRGYNPLRHYLTLTLVLAAFAYKLEWRLALLTLLLLATLFSNRRRRIYRGFIGFVLPLIAIGFVINGIFFTGNVVFRIGPVEFHDAGLLFAASVASRLAMIVISISWYFAYVKPDTMSEYLRSRGADRRFLYVYLLSVAMVQLMRDKLQKIFVAQSARGLDPAKSLLSRVRYILPLMVPLSFSYLAESLDRGLALKAANFDADETSGGRTGTASTLAYLEVNRAGFIAGRTVFLCATVFGILQYFI